MKLNNKRTILIGLAFASILCFWQFYDQVIPYILEAEFGLSTLTANSIMAIDNVLAIFMLPLFGALSDKTQTRLGKRTPYILVGTLLAVVFLCILSYMEHTRNFIGFFACLMLLLLAMSTYRSPAVAYMPDVTPKPLRSKANAVINLVGYLGGIFATIMMMILLRSETAADGSKVYTSDQSFVPIFLVVAGFMLVSVLVMVFTVKENKTVALAKKEMDAAGGTEDEPEAAGDSAAKLSKPVMRSLVLILLSVFLWYAAYNSVTTAFSRYCVAIWNVDLGASSSYLLTATIVAIISFVPLGLVSSRLGRKRTVLLGITLMTVCYLCAIFIRRPSAIMYVLFGIVGIGWAAINVNSFPMVVEMCRSGAVGKYTGYYYTFSMAAQILTPVLSGWFITRLSYNVLFPYAAVFSTLSFITMSMVRHGDNRPTAKRGLEAFEELDV